MCFKRPDGYRIKNVNPYQKFAAHVMRHRHDAQNYATLEFDYGLIEEFIERQYKENGKKYSYTDIIICSLVRLFAKRPSLNRFVMRSKIYQHNDITITFVVKKTLRDDSEDTTVKLHFKGTENLDEVKAALDKVVSENTGNSAYNKFDSTAKLFASMPYWAMRWLVKIFRFLDDRNLLPASLIETSCFHNSIFITLLKSINGDAIYHHCYDFGTTGLFLAVGKEQLQPVVKCGEITTAKIMKVGCVMDERFCDGFYFVNSTRVWKRMFDNLDQLLENYEITEQVENALLTKEAKLKNKQLDKERKQREKQEKREAKRLAREEKKKNKK